MVFRVEWIAHVRLHYLLFVLQAIISPVRFSKLKGLHYLERGGAPLPLPRSGSCPGCSQAGTTSGGGMGGLRVTVVVNPPGNQPSRDHHSSCALQPVELPMERAEPPTGSVPAVSLELLPTTGCRSLHRRVSRCFLERKIMLHCCSSGSSYV